MEELTQEDKDIIRQALLNAPLMGNALTLPAKIAKILSIAKKLEDREVEVSEGEKVE